MAKKNFKKLTADEIGALTGKDLDEYKAWLESDEGKAHIEKQAAAASSGSGAAPTPPAPQAPPAPKVNVKAIGEKYFEGNPDSELDSVLVTSDGQIFPNTAKGKNHCANYIEGRKPLGVTLTYSTYTR